ncbi:hypothetical protein [Entomohabitans teleogrylli]|uniref:hypothetical protein n=1 Tax=Entomohabitans teleogrylli TaxID=1384589 RepID=UPI000AC4F0F4|nr:hypothetical protein [Entomohabitans teleogrylli]
MKKSWLLSAIAVIVVTNLVACKEDAEEISSPAAGSAVSPPPEANNEPAYKYSLSDGPDICFQKVKEKLGATATVYSIRSSFAPGEKITSDTQYPDGAMTTCSVSYPNPDDPRKLLSMWLDNKTGEFQKPREVEIRVSGDASRFRLEDYLISLEKVDLSHLETFMAEQETALGKRFSVWAWKGVRLEEPGVFNNVHRLDIGVEGRLASNDIKDSGYATLSVDSKKVIKNRLMK